MKPLFRRGVLAAVLLAGFGREAMAQNSPYGAPSILPLPEARSSVPSGYQTVAPSESLGGYRQMLVANQEPVDTPPPTLDVPSDTPQGTGASIGNGIGNRWWNPLGIGGGGGATSTASPGTGSGIASGSDAGCLICSPASSNRWFGSVGGLAMTRNPANPFWTTASSTNNADQLMNTKQAGYGVWGAGGQATFGRWWCPCPCNTGCNASCGPSYAYGLQFTYWQLGDMNGYVGSNNNTFNFVTPINTTTGVTQTLNGNTIDHYFDGTNHQAIWRTDRFLNIEINGLVQPIYNNPGRCNVTLLGGFRYFRFQDILTYGSAAGSFNFNDNGGVDAAYLQSNVTNNLFGGQIGALFNVAITPTWGLFAMPKAGLFGNQINITNSLYGGNGVYAFNYHASATTVSLLGELDTGMYWWMSPNCQLFFGWRVIGVSNVALADNQFLPYMADAAGFHTVKSNGDLILTGGFGGFAFAF